MAGFGKTFALDANGDLRVNELNRFEWIRGERTVVQRLKVTLSTIQGEDPFDEDHGLDVFAATGTSDARLRLEIVQALSRDKDVRSVDNVTVSDPDDDRNAEVTVTVTLADENQVRFNT